MALAHAHPRKIESRKTRNAQHA